jgi:glycosyltransferase involved in cell wall biosynthesis
VIALADVWWLPYFAEPHVRRQMELTRTPWVLYFPIDGDTGEEWLPASWIEVLREVDVPVAMSRYGQKIAKRCGIDCDYIPHGVDLEIFSPLAVREQAKALVDAAGKFLVLSDSRNQPRKMLPRLLDIFAKFAAGRPDALLHLHTDPDDEFTKSSYSKAVGGVLPGGRCALAGFKWGGIRPSNSSGRRRRSSSDGLRLQRKP